MAISSWSTTAASNGDADANINFSEGQAPSTVNNSARALMAAIRTWYEDAEWRDFGDTPTRTGNTTFTVSGDLTARYVANRAIRCTDSSTLYGFIVSVSHSGGTTTVTVAIDGGTALSASLSAVALGVTPTNNPVYVTQAREAINDIGSIGGGAQDIDLELGGVVKATVDTSTTTFTFSNPPPSGIAGSFTLYLTNGGSQTVNWPASVRWAGGSAPTLTSSGLDILSFITLDGGTNWDGFVSGVNMS